MSAEFLEVRTPDGFTFWDFDKKVIRSALREVGKDVRKAVRQRISKRAVSRPGEPPGKQSGEMQKSIKATVSKSGNAVWIRPTKTKNMREFYPAFVVFGHRGPRTDSANQHSKKRQGNKVALPRENFMKVVAEEYRKRFEDRMEDAFVEGIKS